MGQADKDLLAGPEAQPFHRPFRGPEVLLQGAHRHRLPEIGLEDLGHRAIGDQQGAQEGGQFGQGQVPAALPGQGAVTQEALGAKG